MKFSAMLKKGLAVALAAVMGVTFCPVTPGAIVKADGTDPVDGYTVTTPDKATTYTFDFTNSESEFVSATTTNKADVGLLSFDAGTKNACKYHSATYGVEFKEGNTLTFKVAGNAYVVLTGDSNSNADLTASTETGSIESSKTQSSKTAGHGTLEGCLAKDANAVVFEYSGGEGTVTITVGATKAYINAAVIIPIVDESAPVDGYTVTIPNKATTYTFDFTDNNSEFVSTAATNKANVGLLSFDAGTKNACKYHSATYGVEFKEGNMLTFKVGGSAYIVLTGDNNSNADLTASTETGSIESSKTQSSKTAGHGTLEGCLAKDANAVVFEYSGGEGTVTITVGASKAYINAAVIIPIAEVAGGNAESFTFVMDENVKDGQVATGVYKFADSTLLLAGETVDGKITQYTVKKDKKVVMDGTEVDSYTAGKRHATANDIPTIPGEGDGTLTVFTPAGKGMMTVYFNSTSFLRVWDFNTDGTRNGYVDSDTGITQYSFAVAPGHAYVMSTTGKTNNMFYAGYKYIVNEKIANPVTVTNVDATLSDALEITAVDADLGGDAITITTDTTSLDLLKGHTYRLSTNDGGVEALCGESDTFTATGETVAITLHGVADETLTGKITGTDASAVTGLTFTNMVNGTAYEAVITGDSYTCSMKPGEYNTSVVTTNGGVTYDRVSVQAGVENVNEVFVEVADLASKRNYSYDAIETLPTTGSVGVEAGKAHCVATKDATITIPVSGKAKVIVKAYYQADFTMNGEQKTVTSKSTSTIDTFAQVVESDVTLTFNATSYLLGIEVIPIIPFKSEISVPGDYDSLNDASDAILGMENRPEGEAGRVTINLNADQFEQVVMAAPYVTLKGNNHTISWYYGVGTNYYSIEPGTGLYSERLARDKYSFVEGDGNLWGGVFIVRGNNFIAEDTTFKNTYNYELTEAEKTDIAGTGYAGRLADGADVSAYKYKERSNAFYIDADNIECYNCKILSSQDTLGRNGSANNNYHTYFRKCVIGGNVDYICGEFAAVFDECELQWKSYSGDASNNAKIGYIVAPKTSPYVFRNCTITTSGAEGSDPVTGLYGRTWGANSNASFINTETNGHIKQDGWGEMSTGERASAVFNEYNNTENGEVMYTTGYTNNTEEAVKNYIDTDEIKATDTVLGSWVPVHYPAADDDDDDEVEYNNAESTTIPETVLTDAVKAKTRATTVEGLIKYIETTLKNSSAVAEMGTPDGYKTVDVTVLYKEGENGTWKPIDGDKFPAEGVKVVLSYPAGTGKTGYKYSIAHLIVNGYNGQTPGEIEFLPYTLTDDGLEVTIKSTSPFTIAWKKIVDDDDDDDDDDDKGNIITTVVKNDTQASPKTFDRSKFVPEVPEAELAKFVQRQEVEDLLITPQANKFPFGIVIAALLAMVAFIGGEAIYFRRKK